MSTPDMTKGLVALPEHNVALATRKVNGVGMDLLGPRTRHGLGWHRAQGNGAAGWLSRPDVRGLTDWAISENADATMTEINRITGTDADMSGWAQGPYNSAVASEDARQFVAAYGGFASVINMHLESIEVEGFYDDPIHDNTRRDLARWAASRAHDDGIAWDRYPIKPDGLTHNYGHREFCGVAYKACPGSVLWAYINGELIDRVQPILKAAQVGATAAKPAGPVYRRAPMPPAMKLDPMPDATMLNGVTFRLVNREFRVEALTGCYTSVGSATRSRSSLRPGDVVRIVYLHENNKWGIAAGGSRIPMAHLSEIVDVDQAA
ncbi:hypothetical protein [Nocardioides sp.]|uniref:hypothetical protein n=1 Tax=Nocardioides sp. TaxID=35761 RepID=UPI002C09C22F|nr:hypothetical protein [Nocardioides sp.]HXH79503.1 hypothetical protein [Nocardioides sp.]